MKIHYLIIAVLHLTTFGAFGQPNADVVQLSNSQKSSISKGQIYSYYVVERVNLRSGTQITSYEVSDERFINTADLGPNNTRTITPKYRSVKINTRRTKKKSGRPNYENIANDYLASSDFSAIEENNSGLSAAANEIIRKEDSDRKSKNSRNSNPSITDREITDLASAGNTSPTLVNTNIDNIDFSSIENSRRSAIINIPMTYERILNKGYRSEKLLKIVGDEYFFNLDYNNASKWYSELLALKTNLDAIYYYRYAKSLASINEVEKSNEIMKIFESKN